MSRSRSSFDLDGAIATVRSITDSDRSEPAGQPALPTPFEGVPLVSFQRAPDAPPPPESPAPQSPLRRAAGLAMTFLRFLNHYPSHILVFAAIGRLDWFFWMYLGLNLLYAGKSMLGVLLRLGGPGAYRNRAS